MKKKKVYDTAPFNRFKVPPKQNLFFLPIIWLLCWIMGKKNHLTIERKRMKKLKPPYLVLATHHSFMDFCIPPLALFPHRANSVSELEGFENYGEWLYRQAGCLGTRKFVNDLALVRNIRRVIQRKGILILYPEARYANAGTQSALPFSVGKLAKQLNVPVVTVNMHGNYLQSPIWNLKKRHGVPLFTEVQQLLTVEDLAAFSVKEIQERIQCALSYDEYAWQKEQQISITEPFRCEGLHSVLYQCCHCHQEYQMESKGTQLFCTNCQTSWEMSEYGELLCQDEKEEAEPGCFQHIPNWYEWQREQVIKEIRAGHYEMQWEVRIEALPNAKNFIPLGEGILTHRKEGFALSLFSSEGKQEKLLEFSSGKNYSIHTEYDYRGKGQCITLSTLDNTYFIFPLSPHFNVTKIQFATEYLYQLAQKHVEVPK